jgi:fused signal recognition particle receptor
MALNWFKKKKKAPEQETASTPENIPPEAESQEAAQAAERPQDDGLLEKAALKDQKQGQPDEAQGDHAPAAPDQAPSPEPPESSPVGETAATEPRQGLFARLKRGLAKTRDILTTDIEDLFSGRTQIDDDMLEELEELLITSDIGVQTAMDLIAAIQRQASKINGAEGLKEALRSEIRVLLEHVEASAPPAPKGKPHVIMVVGVNGVGKTTTIGKLAARAREKGESVLIAAADTFRAAAVEQLSIWAERAGAHIVKHKDNADPAAVAFDGIEAAMARDIDTVFVDTAGRLHTKVNLMEELKKIKRSIAKKIPDAPHEILLVLDATTGQNALSQAQLFHEAIGVTSLALTKLDGTAKGGIVIRICQSMNLPLHYVGVGESIEDLQPFDPVQFVEALF